MHTTKTHDSPETLFNSKCRHSTSDKLILLRIVAVSASSTINGYERRNNTSDGASKVLDASLSNLSYPTSQIAGTTAHFSYEFIGPRWLYEPSESRWNGRPRPSKLTITQEAACDAGGDCVGRANGAQFDIPIPPRDDFNLPRSRSFTNRVICWHNCIFVCARAVCDELFLGMAVR